MINSKDIKSFLELEKDLSLFERKYDGFYYWQFLRFHLCESLFGNRINLVKEENKKRKSFYRFVIETITALIISLKEFLFLCFCKSVDMLLLKENSIKDKFFDSWKIPEEISSYSFRTVPYENTYEKNDHFLEWPRIRTKLHYELHNRLGLFKAINDKKEKKFLVKLEKKLVEIYGQCISADEMEKMIQEMYVENKFYSKYFRWLFRMTKCKAVVVVVYYKSYLFSAYKVAKNNGIRVIELQHGVINNHEEYWFEDRRGINNYTPDYLLTYGDIHNSWIKLVNEKKPISIGYPYQEKCINKLKNLETDEKLIVIYPESDSVFENILDRFINIIVLFGYKVVMKIHPLQTKNVSLYYPVLSKNKNVKIITKDNSEGIYYWLKRAKHHIMASTTVGLEAVAFDHTNICICLNIPHDQTQCLLDWGIARGFSSEDELVDLIKNPIIYNSEFIDEIRTQLWKNDAINNVTDFFRVIKANKWDY